MPPVKPIAAASTLVLFNYDWDKSGFARWAADFPTATAGFDLFSFPSNVNLAWFSMPRFIDQLHAKARRAGWQAVVSNHEQFGALAAALLAERMGWPGTPVAAVLACQHKLHARRVLQEVCPEANLPFAPLQAAYGEPAPEGLSYPLFVKPVKAAFSVLAKTVTSHAALHAHTRFGRWELWVIRHLVEPFEQIARERLPQAGTAHRMVLEQPIKGHQYNLDGYVFEGDVRSLGIVDAVMYPGTDAFMRFDYPSRLAPAVQAQALDVARRFLLAVGFTHGMFNMEFFWDEATGKLTVIEFNPRMASQFSDLYLRVHGIDLHRMALELAWGRDPAMLSAAPASAGAAASFVYRILSPDTTVTMPQADQRARFAQAFPDAMLMTFPKPRGSMQRDFKWLGSYRYGIVHLGGADVHDLRQRCERASALLDWPAPYAGSCAEPNHARCSPTATHPFSMETSS
ncbi:MAG: ATP-grasp domain-containing protein [Rhodoferax sp.]|nr:ATP-grasp domain-containing protein [Rhodoferax sp.]